MGHINKILFLILLFTIPLYSSDTLHLVTCEWPPYLSDTLPNGGISTHITQEAFNKVGIPTKVSFMDWNRAVGLSKSGKVDVLVGCYNTEERKKYFAISQKIGDVSVVFFKRRDFQFTYKTLDNLRKIKIGAMRGNAHTEEFDNADYLQKEFVDDMLFNIKKLLSKRVDLIIGSRLVILDIINRHVAHEKEQIELVYPPLSEVGLHIGISKQLPQHNDLIAKFNKGLNLLIEDGTLDTIKTFHKF